MAILPRSTFLLVSQLFRPLILCWRNVKLYNNFPSFTPYQPIVRVNPSGTELEKIPDSCLKSWTFLVPPLGVSCPPASSFPGFSGLKSIHSFIPEEIHHLPSPLVLSEITTRNCYQFGNPTPGSDKRHLNSLLLIVSSLIRIQPTAPNIQKSLYWTMKVPIPLETNCPSIQHQSSPYRSRSGLYSPAVPTIPRETTVLRRSKHPPLNLCS